MEDNKQNSVQEQQKKKKSRFGMVLGVVIVIMAITFSYLTLCQKEKYVVLDNASKEVKSMLTNIKDIRTLKGYKVLSSGNDKTLILVSAGLSYDSEGFIELVGVKFDKDIATITVDEHINPNPENEKITYPYIIVKLNSNIANINVLNVSGEAYEEIEVNKHTNEAPVKQEEKQEEVIEENQEEVKETDDEEAEDTSEENETEEQSTSTKTLTCVYEGKADGTTIEISVGGNYKTFDISDVSSKFDNMEVGKEITIDYIETLGNGKIVNVK